MVSENTQVTRLITYLEYYNGYPDPKAFVSAPKLSQACGYEVETVRLDFRLLRKGFCERQWRRVGEMTQ